MPYQRPILQDSFEALSLERIARFEKKHGLRFPSEYREFLRKHNGGYYHQEAEYRSTEVRAANCYPEDLIYVSDFIPLEAELGSMDLDFLLRLGQSPNSSRQVTITGDGMGNGVVLSLPDNLILEWDHETDALKPTGLGFAEFLNGIHYSPDEEQDWRETESPFIEAERGDVDAIAAYEKLEERNSEGRTLLGIAALAGQREIVRHLLSRGADVHARDNAGDTPLLLASKVGAFDNAKLLIDYSADIDVADRMGTTPLMAAIRGCQTRTAKLLIELGADVNARDARGITPLGCCVNHDEEEYIAPLLRARGAIE